MKGVFGGTWTSSVMSSSGRARSMNACRLERNTRKRWSRRMSTEAGWTHFGSNGSIPIRPASIAARMSRSERTTATRVRRGSVQSARPPHLAACAVADHHRLLSRDADEGGSPSLSPTAALLPRGDRLRDGQRDLLRDAAIARFLADAHERCQLVVKRIDVLDGRIDDLEAEIREGVAFGEPLEHHLADPSRRDLGCAALPDACLELADDPAELTAA